MEILIELLGGFGILFAVLAFQCKKHNRVIAFRNLNMLFFAGQYVLLGAYTGMAMNIIGMIRNVIFSEQVKRGKSTRISISAFCAIFLVAGIITWEGPKSILLILAKFISTAAYGNKNLLVVRLLVLFTSSSWLFYNLLVGSYAGMLCEVLTLASILLSLWRYHIPHGKRADATKETNN